MLSHTTVGTNDIERAATFYDAVLLPIGLKRRQVKPDGGPAAVCWEGERDVLPRFYVYVPFDGNKATVGNGSMVAFLAADPVTVDRSYKAGLASGGVDEGAPGVRAHYGDGYYGAYLRDPDGNKIHIVCRGQGVTRERFLSA